MKKKVVLAYSGGLDTSIILTYLKKEVGYDVIAVCVDVGQDENFAALEKKAIQTGASKVYIVDCKQEFVNDFIFMGLKAGAIYEDDYLLGTAYARPIIAKALVEIAIAENADAIAHGATGKGNDQVRFETSIKALLPQIKIIAPWREWNFNSRESLLNYAADNNIPLPINSKQEAYSRDENLWHISHEGLDLEDPANAHSSNIYKKTVEISKTPDYADEITISFEQGVPTKINHKTMTGVDIIKYLNKIGGKHGIGVADIVESRLVGMKSRGVYETPGGTILYQAHKSLEKLTLDGDTLHYKQIIALKYAEICYNGKWYTALREALDAFINETQKWVTGDITLKLFKGNVTTIKSESTYSLYDQEIVTFEADDVYNQADATGFINLYALSTKVAAIKHHKNYCQEMKPSNKKLAEL